MKKHFYFKQVKYKYAVKCKNTSILNKLNISTQFKWQISFPQWFSIPGVYFKQFSFPWVRSLDIKNISISNYSVYSNSSNSANLV